MLPCFSRSSFSVPVSPSRSFDGCPSPCWSCGCSVSSCDPPVPAVVAAAGIDGDLTNHHVGRGPVCNIGRRRPKKRNILLVAAKGFADPLATPNTRRRRAAHHHVPVGICKYPSRNRTLPPLGLGGRVHDVRRAGHRRHSASSLRRRTDRPDRLPGRPLQRAPHAPGRQVARHVRQQAGGSDTVDGRALTAGRYTLQMLCAGEGYARSIAKSLRRHSPRRASSQHRRIECSVEENPRGTVPRLELQRTHSGSPAGRFYRGSKANAPLTRLPPTTPTPPDRSALTCYYAPALD